MAKIIITIMSTKERNFQVEIIIHSCSENINDLLIAFWWNVKCFVTSTGQNSTFFSVIGVLFPSSSQGANFCFSCRFVQVMMIEDTSIRGNDGSSSSYIFGFVNIHFKSSLIKFSLNGTKMSLKNYLYFRNSLNNDNQKFFVLKTTYVQFVIVLDVRSDLTFSRTIVLSNIFPKITDLNA